MSDKIKIARGFLRKDEQQTFLDCAPDPSQRVCFLMMLDLGLRLEETQHPTIGDLMGQSLTVHGKGNTWRQLPTTTRLRMAAGQLLQHSDLTPDDTAARIRPRTIQKYFHRALHNAGISRSGLSCHSLRHSYACNLLNQGIPINNVCALMGHANIATTASYLHCTDDHLDKAAAALDSNARRPAGTKTTPAAEDHKAQIFK